MNAIKKKTKLIGADLDDDDIYWLFNSFFNLLTILFKINLFKYINYIILYTIFFKRSYIKYILKLIILYKYHFYP